VASWLLLETATKVLLPAWGALWALFLEQRLAIKAKETSSNAA